jgi:tetratricopeptide (TPR) repeat protein/tRNA A-37 threonylcarbamoyl transferase component Bud32
MSATGPSEPTELGSSLSHYTILEELHRGQMQIVYRARDEKLNREVALKVLPPELVSDPERKRRFVAEARAAASLEHPHIGVIHEIDESNGVVFLAMELLRGPSLAARLDSGAIDVAEAMDIAIGVGAGLAYAHEHGVVHRDVKPQNVVLTEDGHPKLIDFGIAKLLDAAPSPFLGQAGEAARPADSTTREGLISGTASYMSPEQARGGKVDARSDVFSFGLLLYTMIAGRPAFEGATRIDVLHAILHDPTPRLSGLNADARDLLEPIVRRCLEKEPDRRYQLMSEVLEALKRARLEIQKGSRFAPRLMRVLFTAGGLALGAAALFYLFRQPPPEAPPGRPSIGVLQFDNLSGDPTLDWLRTGLPDMLVTDLSQSPELHVLGLDRIYPILEEMDRVHAGALTRDTIDEVARRAGVEAVLLGSFARAGDSIRISARLEEPSTGRVLLSEKAEARGEDSIFRLVDEITSRIKKQLDIETPEEGFDRDLREVTTDSVEAYRAYAEGIRLHERFREEEAVPHFQRAIELDPHFAMALAKLGVVLSNVGLHEEADEFAERALENVDRLSERERYYIEGWYFSRKPETMGRALDSYRRAIEIYPDHGSARHNLGHLLFLTERYEDAVEQFEELREGGMLFPATYEQLALAYAALDELDSARSVLTEYSRRYPDDWTTLLTMAQLDLGADRIDEGLALVDRAEALGATPFRAAAIRWQAHVLRENWQAAFDDAERMLASGGPVETFVGGKLASTTALYRGRVRPVLSRIDEFVSAVEGNRAYRIQPLLLKARILLEAGDYPAAEATALEISDAEDRYGTAHQALALAAIAAQHRGEDARAQDLAREYERRILPALGAPPVRLEHLLQGELALVRGNFRAAIGELQEAESMLPPRGYDGAHTIIWYSLATAHRLQGNDDEAIDWYERIVEAKAERLMEPIPYVRSYYYLGELLDQAGDDEEALHYFERFLDHWQDGELDRDLVSAARARLRRN